MADVAVPLQPGATVNGVAPKARELGWQSIAAVISDHAEGTTGDQGAENVLRKTLTPLEPGTVASDATFVGPGDAGTSITRPDE